MAAETFPEQRSPLPRWCWFVMLLLCCTTSGRRAPAEMGAGRPSCAQPFAAGKCLEGTWPATWRDGHWDCKIVQDQLELDGIPADRCASFVGAEEVAAHMRTMSSRRGRPAR